MKIFLVVLIWSLFSLSIIQGSIYKTKRVVIESSNEVVLEKWNSLLSKLKTVTDDVLRIVLPMAIRVSSEVDISTECQATLLKLVFAIRKGEFWAVKMLDASGKPFSGVTAGTISDLGSYKSCLDIHLKNEYSEDIRGQYCLLDLRPPLPKKPAQFSIGEIIEPFTNLSRTYNNQALTDALSYIAQLYTFAIRLGICLPSTCTKEDIQNIASYGATQLGVYADVPSCEVKSPLTFNTEEIVILSVFGIFAFLVTLGTVFDVTSECLANWKSEREDDPKKRDASPTALRFILVSCSIRRNIPALMNCESSQDKLGFLNGVRVIAMFGIIVSHVHIIHEYQALREPRHLSETFDSLSLQPTINGRLHVDTFVFISALLFSYLTLTNQGKIGNKIVTQLILIIRRIWRLQPMLFIVMGFVILSPLIGSGPLWHESLDDIVEKCNTDWWKSLLFLNNFYPIADICLSISWYVSMDMQLFVISSLIYVIYTRTKFLAYIVLGALYLLSIIPITAFTYMDPRSYPPSFNLRNGEPQQIFEMSDKTNIALHLHFGVYVTGIITGAVLAKIKKMPIPWGCRATTWILMFLGYGLVCLGTGKWSVGELPDPIVSALYAASFRIVWSLGLAWLSIACFYGYGGYIGDFLSWRFFVPLSRLTYLMYLTHVPILETYNASTYGIVDYRQIVMIFNSFAIVSMSLIFSIFMYLIFECPLKSVDKILFTNLLRKGTAKDRKLQDNTTKL